MEKEKNKRKDKEQKVTARLEIVRQITMFRHNTLLPQSKRAQDRAAWGLKVLLNISIDLFTDFINTSNIQRKAQLNSTLQTREGLRPTTLIPREKHTTIKQHTTRSSKQTPEVGALDLQ